jgi:hypothetical protein
MRRRAGDVGNAVPAQPRDMIGDRFVGSRQHHRTAANDGAQENLKAAIAADVTECRPHRWRAMRGIVGDNRAG